jgi:hypothetical protein
LLECAPNVARCYRFDQFALNSGTRQLLRDGKEVHVSPKAFDLLCALVENRRALGDSAEEPTFVQTLHRFGYRFIAAVHEDIPADEEPVTPHVRYWLVWETRQIPLGNGPNVLGRAPDAGVWIDAPGVSRSHAQITVAGRDATVEDLGSKNGTFVKGERITAPYHLADGDQIRLGSVVITFRIPPPAGSTESVQSR